MTSLTHQNCIQCSMPFKGRKDKKFCSDQCRTTYNNIQKRNEHDYISGVNKVLKKNRKILLNFNPKGKSRVTKEVLKARGFDFNHFTSTYTTKDGMQYYYCYEQGYLPMEKDQYLLVIKKEFY